MNWNSQESAPLPQANFKMGGFSDSEAGRLICYKKHVQGNSIQEIPEKYNNSRVRPDPVCGMVVEKA